MLIGYVDAGRGRARHRAAMRAAGVQDGAIYEGEDGLDACLRAATPGDTLMVWRVNQLGANLRDRIRLIEDVRAKGVTLRVLGRSRAADDDGALMTGVVAALAAFKRDLDIERAKLMGRQSELQCA